MITVGAVYANDNDGPSSHGFRVAYGGCGIGDEYYGWAEFWAAYREGGDQDSTSVGLSLVPISLIYRRVALGALIDVGFERRKHPDRVVLAGVIGTGADFAVRLARRWDFFTAVEIDYRTTFAAETQVRFGVRFHHEKLGTPWKDR